MDNVCLLYVNYEAILCKGIQTITEVSYYIILNIICGNIFLFRYILFARSYVYIGGKVEYRIYII